MSGPLTLDAAGRVQVRSREWLVTWKSSAGCEEKTFADKLAARNLYRALSRGSAGSGTVEMWSGPPGRTAGWSLESTSTVRAGGGAGRARRPVSVAAARAELSKVKAGRR